MGGCPRKGDRDSQLEPLSRQTVKRLCWMVEPRQLDFFYFNLVSTMIAKKMNLVNEKIKANPFSPLEQPEWPPEISPGSMQDCQ